MGHRLARRPAGRAHDRQASTHRLRQHHAVALEQRGHDEDVRGLVEAVERRRYDGAGEADAVVEARRFDRRLEAGDGDGIAVERADDAQAPIEVAQGRQRLDQHAISLSPGDGPDGEELHRRAGSRGARGGIGSRLRNADLLRRDGEVESERAGHRWARHDHVTGQRQRGTLGVAKFAPPVLRKARLEAQRMVHQRDDGAVEAPDQVRRQGSEGEAIDEEDGIARGAGQPPLRQGEIGRGGGGEARGQLDQADGNAVGRQQLEHAAVVGVAAGGGLDVAGYGERRP